jgi:hypothetical protein
MAERIINALVGVIAILVLVAAIRSRRAENPDIHPSEINPDLAAGEELLQDALEAERCNAHGRD